MTFEIKQTQLGDTTPEAFKAMVVDHIKALHLFAKTINKPRPTASPLVAAAITRIQRPGQPDNYVPDYVIVDDREKEVLVGPTLEERKHMLHCQAAELMEAAKAKILPRRKQPLLAFKFTEAAAKKLEDRTPEDVALIDDYEEKTSLFKSIELTFYQAQHDIEDLTEENIDAWKLPSYKS